METSLTLINLCRQGEVPVFGPDRPVARCTSGSSSPTTSQRLELSSVLEGNHPDAATHHPESLLSATILLCNQLFLGFALCLGSSQAALLILNCNSNEAAQADRVSASVYSTVVLAKVLLTPRLNLYQNGPRSKRDVFKQLRTRKPSRKLRPDVSGVSYIALTSLGIRLSPIVDVYAL